MKIITEVYVKKDGSGKLTETVYVAKTITSLAEEFGDSKEDVMPPLDRVKGIIRAQKMGKGVYFVSSQSVVGAHGQHGVKTIFSFEDISKLKLSVEVDSLVADFSPELLPKRPSSSQQPLTFDFSEKPMATLVVNIPYDETAPPPAAKESAFARDPTGMWQILSGFGVWIRIKFDGTIEKADASFVNPKKNGITLIKLDFAKAASRMREDGAQAADIEKVHDLASARRILSDVEGVIIESKSRIEVSFK